MKRTTCGPSSAPSASGCLASPFPISTTGKGRPNGWRSRSTNGSRRFAPARPKIARGARRRRRGKRRRDTSRVAAVRRRRGPLAQDRGAGGAVGGRAVGAGGGGGGSKNGNVE